MNYTLSHEGSLVHIALNGDLDIEGSYFLKDSLIPKLLDYPNVNFDFRKVAFVDSTGIGMLISTTHTLIQNNIPVTITGISKEVQEIFELVQISAILGDGVIKYD